MAMESDEKCADGSLRWRNKKQLLKPIEVTKKACNSSTNKVRSPELGGGGGDDGIGNEGEPLSPAARLFHEPRFNVYVIAIMGCRTPIHTHVVKSNLPHTLLKHPRFSSCQLQVGNGEMRWAPTEVDLEKHVIEVAEAEVMSHGDPKVGDEFVEEYVYNLTRSSIPRTQPLWDLHILHVKTSECESVGVFRIHHSLGDGASLMSLLLACTRQLSDPQALPTVPVNTKKQKQNKQDSKTGDSYRRAFWKVFMGIWSVFQLMWNTIVHVFMFVATALFLKDSDSPLKGPVGAEFNPRRIVYRTVSLDDIKFVKNAMDTTVNDVALGMAQAGLSRYLGRKIGDQNKKGEGQPSDRKDYLPKNIRLRSTLLINLRPSVGIQAFADMMEKEKKGNEAKYGNWIGYVLLPFKIGIREDPLDYVREAKATVDRKKHSLEAIFTFSIAEFVLKLFGIKAASALSHRILAHTTMCFSNLVGPVEEIGYHGHPIAYLAATSYGQPHALMINFQSYVNKMTIALSVDEGTIPDPHQLCDDIAESLELIKDAVVAAGFLIKGK